MRHVDANEYFENFMISAIAAILGIRVFLHLSGYPTVGGDSLHVAHMLWGGLLMLVALLMTLGYLGRPVRSAASVIGGLGWGTFIDELGKFLTHDNDYFFQPTFALIYVSFVVLYVVWERLHSRHMAEPEALANALELTLEAVRRDMDADERRRTLELLQASSATDPIARRLAEAITEVELVPVRPPGLLQRVRRGVRSFYADLVRRRWFPTAVIAFFVVHAVNSIVQAAALVNQLATSLLLFAAGLVAAGVLLRPHGSDEARRRGPPAAALAVVAALAAGLVVARPVLPGLSAFSWAEVVATVVPALIVLLGVLRLRRSRLAAYRTFKTAVLISIFVTQFFAFYHEQLVAIVGLTANILVWITLRHAIGLEQDYARPPVRAGP
ncbi:MAG TPA: hypothetical protein VK929_13380 [Longimicrobiales bacterium]|nr:hypothetical protein [Longimicrobiales bacterium]